MLCFGYYIQLASGSWKVFQRPFDLSELRYHSSRGGASRCHCDQADEGRISRIFENTFKVWSKNRNNRKTLNFHFFSSDCCMSLWMLTCLEFIYLFCTKKQIAGNKCLILLFSHSLQTPLKFNFELLADKDGVSSFK